MVKILNKSEKDLENRISQSLLNKGYTVHNQVHLSCKRVDIAYIDSKKSIISIEVKLFDWKNALKQAYLNKFSFHQSFVAFHEDYIHRIESHFIDFKHRGIGIIEMTHTGYLKKRLNAEFNSNPNFYLISNLLEDIDD